MCRNEAPAVAEAARELGNDVTIIGVGGNSGTNEDEYAAFVNSTGVDGFTHIFDPSGEIWRSYSVFSQPSWAFINDDGDINTIARSLGRDTIIDEANKLRNS